MISGTWTLPSHGQLTTEQPRPTQLNDTWSSPLVNDGIRAALVGQLGHVFSSSLRSIYWRRSYGVEGISQYVNNATCGVRAIQITTGQKYFISQRSLHIIGQFSELAHYWTMFRAFKLSVSFTDAVKREFPSSLKCY